MAVDPRFPHFIRFIGALNDADEWEAQLASAIEQLASDDVIALTRIAVDMNWSSFLQGLLTAENAPLEALKIIASNEELRARLESLRWSLGSASDDWLGDWEHPDRDGDLIAIAHVLDDLAGHEALRNHEPELALQLRAFIEELRAKRD